MEGDSIDSLAGYFLLGDSLNTTVTVIATLQNELVAYNTLQLTYLLIVGIATQAVGIFAFWHIQKRFQLSTKTMFNVVAVGIILLDAWGMIGIWTDRFGFHHTWEVWLYQAYYGFFVCPWYAYSQTVRHGSFTLPALHSLPIPHPFSYIPCRWRTGQNVSYKLPLSKRPPISTASSPMSVAAPGCFRQWRRWRRTLRACRTGVAETCSRFRSDAKHSDICSRPYERTTPSS